MIVPVFILILGAISCGEKAVPEQEVKGSGGGLYSYLEEFNTLDDILKYSSDVVKATLVSTEDFDGRINVYLFNVEENYFGDASNEIHMYDAYNEQYIIGHSYYLFLCGSESALYPHKIYTTVVKDFILDEMSLGTEVFANGDEIAVNTLEIESAVSDAVTNRVVGEKAEEAAYVTNSDDIREISGEADVIAEIQVFSEMHSNKYSSTYSLEVLNILKGPEGAVASHMNLPPDLDPDTTYYVFLKEDPECPGNYLLCSRVYPVADTAVFTAEGLSLEG